MSNEEILVRPDLMDIMDTVRYLVMRGRYFSGNLGKWKDLFILSELKSDLIGVNDRGFQVAIMDLYDKGKAFAFDLQANLYSINDVGRCTDLQRYVQNVRNYQRLIAKDNSLLSLVNQRLIDFPNYPVDYDVIHQMIDLHHAQLATLRGLDPALTAIERSRQYALENGITTSGKGPVDQFAFTRDGDTWNVVFEGKATHIHTCKGMEYIAVLLASPHKSISCTDLRGSTEVPLSALQDETYAEENYQSRAKGMSLDVTSVADPESVRLYKAKEIELEEKLETAKDTGNSAGEGQLMAELEQLRKGISYSAGLYGKLRTEGPTKKARQAVSKAIKTAIDKMKKKHPKAWSHFHLTIKTGFRMKYQPENPVVWHILTC